MRVAIVDPKVNKVINVVEFTSIPTGDVPGFPKGFRAFASETAGPGDDMVSEGVFEREPVPPLSGAELEAAIKTECRRRIYAFVDQIAQVNLAAAAAGDVLTGEQMTTYRAGLAWIAAMRTKCSDLISGSDQTFAENRHWPDPDPAVIVLAQQF